tara:strand:- start:189 stop:431 length:243 start_codon:yes stop_codon:yes gene_type:complete
MNRKFVKENKPLVREFISSLISAIVTGKLSKNLEKTLMSKPETKKDIQDVRKMRKDLEKRLEKTKQRDPEAYKRIKSYFN